MITKDQLKVGIFFDYVAGNIWSVFEIKQVDPIVTIMPLYSSVNREDMNTTFEFDITANMYVNIIDDNKLQYYKKISVFT